MITKQWPHPQPQPPQDAQFTNPVTKAHCCSHNNQNISFFFVKKEFYLIKFKLYVPSLRDTKIEIP